MVKRWGSGKGAKITLFHEDHSLADEYAFSNNQDSIQFMNSSSSSDEEDELFRISNVKGGVSGFPHPLPGPSKSLPGHDSPPGPVSPPGSDFSSGLTGPNSPNKVSPSPKRKKKGIYSNLNNAFKNSVLFFRISDGKQ